jgi:hypothetical protein
MPVSQVDVCNFALFKMAQDITIAAITENTKAARTFNRAWDHVRDLVLSDHSWPFALKALPLEEVLETPFPGWGYRYTYPSDCITALAVCTEDGVRAGLSALASCGLDQWRTVAFNGRMPFEVTDGEQDTSIATDLAGAYVIFTRRIEDVSRYPATFVEALACKLAHYTAPAIMGDLGFRAQGQLEQNYQMARSVAAAHGLNQASEDPPAPTPAIAARGGY